MGTNGAALRIPETDDGQYPAPYYMSVLLTHQSVDVLVMCMDSHIYSGPHT